MQIFGRLVFGSLAIFFWKLHYRYEVIPYAKKQGYTLGEVISAAQLNAAKRIKAEWERKE